MLNKNNAAFLIKNIAPKYLSCLYSMQWPDMTVNMCVCVYFREAHLDLRASPACPAPLAPLDQTASMWVSMQVRPADFITKANIVLKKCPSLCAGCSTAILPTEGSANENRRTQKGLCSWQKEGSLREGPSPESTVCVTVTWYIWVIFRVNYTQVAQICCKHWTGETCSNFHQSLQMLSILSWLEYS